MASKLIVMTGNFKEASQHVVGAPAGFQILSQGTETSREAVLRGRNIKELMDACPMDTLTVFTNNEQIFQGIRLAVKDKTVDIRDIVIQHYQNQHAAPLILRMDSGSNIDSWPYDFMDGTDQALMDLLGWSSN